MLKLQQGDAASLRHKLKVANYSRTTQLQEV